MYTILTILAIIVLVPFALTVVAALWDTILDLLVLALAIALAIGFVWLFMYGIREIAMYTRHLLA